MGLSREYILIYGIKGAYGEFSEVMKDIENISDIRECKKDSDNLPFVYVQDGMDTEYEIIGLGIKAYGDQRYNKDIDIDLHITRRRLECLHLAFKKACDKRGLEFDEARAELILICYYS